MGSSQEQESYRVELVQFDSGEKKGDHPLQKYWRPVMAITYILICLFDFIIAPSWIGLARDSIQEKANAISDLPVETQVILAQDRPQWEPLTLMGGGFFHIAFGAIITGAAVTRGMEKTARERSSLFGGPFGGYNEPRELEVKKERPQRRQKIEPGPEAEE